MTYSEDESLLNSDSDGDRVALTPILDTSATVIISDESEEETDNKNNTANPKAFSDKDNKWIKLKEDRKSSDMEEEEESEESELVW